MLGRILNSQNRRRQFSSRCTGRFAVTPCNHGPTQSPRVPTANLKLTICHSERSEESALGRRKYCRTPANAKPLSTMAAINALWCGPKDSPARAGNLDRRVKSLPPSCMRPSHPPYRRAARKSRPFQRRRRTRLDSQLLSAGTLRVLRPTFLASREFFPARTENQAGKRRVPALAKRRGSLCPVGPLNNRE